MPDDEGHWFTVIASVKNSYISILCRVYALTAEGAVDQMKRFVTEARAWNHGFEIDVTPVTDT